MYKNDDNTVKTNEIILPIKRYQNEYASDSLSDDDDLDETHSVQNEPHKYLKLFDDNRIATSLNYKFS
jgi:hypothetical protein